MSIKLLPCPFCGGEARISSDTEATRDSQGRLWAFTVVCDSCCATSGLTYSPERAREVWNTRKPMDNIVEQLKKAVEHCLDMRDWQGQSAYENAIDIVRAGGKE